MKLELNVVRFENEDVIATSGETILLSKHNGHGQWGGPHVEVQPLDFTFVAGEELEIDGEIYTLSNDVCGDGYYWLYDGEGHQLVDNALDGIYVYRDAVGGFVKETD